jgi:hypothetical protein
MKAEKRGEKRKLNQSYQGRESLTMKTRHWSPEAERYQMLEPKFHVVGTGLWKKNLEAVGMLLALESTTAGLDLLILPCVILNINPQFIFRCST